MRDLIAPTLCIARSKLKDDEPDVGNDRGTVVPLFSLFISRDPSIVDCDFRRTGRVNINDIILNLDSNLDCLIKSFLDKNRITSKEAFVQSISSFDRTLHKFINSYEILFAPMRVYTRSSTQMNLRVGFTTNRFQRHNRLLVNKGCCRIIMDGIPRTAVCVMIKKKYIPLFKTMYLMNEAPFGEMFELWYDHELITNNIGRLQFLTPIINKYREGGILLREVRNIDDIILERYTMPPIRSVADIRTNKRSLINRLTNNIIIDNRLNYGKLRKLCNI